MATILLLETDRQLAQNLKGYFGQAGHELLAYSDPQQAVIAADKNHPDIVILDLILASRSGIEFLYELRSYPDWHNIPVIVTGKLTADELEAFSAAFQELGVSKYLHRQTAALADFLTETESLLQPAGV